MTRQRRTMLLVSGLALALTGAGGGSLVMFLTPWKSCPEIDDSSAACPATYFESIMIFGWLAALVIGLGLFAAALLTAPPGWKPRIPPGPREFGDGR